MTVLPHPGRMWRSCVGPVTRSGARAVAFKNKGPILGMLGVEGPAAIRNTMNRRTMALSIQHPAACSRIQQHAAGSNSIQQHSAVSSSIHQYAAAPSSIQQYPAASSSIQQYPLRYALAQSPLRYCFPALRRLHWHHHWHHHLHPAGCC